MADEVTDKHTDLIKQIKLDFRDRELRQMFIQRTHDHLFRKVGELSGAGKEPPAEKPRRKRSKPPQSRQAFESLVVWRGYEALTDSPYREAEK